MLWSCIVIHWQTGYRQCYLRTEGKCVKASNCAAFQITEGFFKCCNSVGFLLEVRIHPVSRVYYGFCCPTFNMETKCNKIDHLNILSINQYYYHLIVIILLTLSCSPLTYCCHFISLSDCVFGMGYLRVAGGKAESNEEKTVGEKVLKRLTE